MLSPREIAFQLSIRQRGHTLGIEPTRSARYAREHLLALLWQIYSRRGSLQIHSRQCGHHCGGSAAGNARRGGGPLLFPRLAVLSRQVIRLLTCDLWASISVLFAGMCLQRSVMRHRSARSMWVYCSLLSAVQAMPRSRRQNRKDITSFAASSCEIFFARWVWVGRLRRC